MKNLFVVMLVLSGLFGTRAFAQEVSRGDLSMEEIERLKEVVKNKDLELVRNIVGTTTRDIIQEAAARGDFDSMREALGLPTSNDLFNAARAGDTDTIIEWIENDDIDDINATTGDTYSTALTFAIREGHPDLVDVLIAAGAEVNFETYYTTPLMIASGRGEERMVTSLIAGGARVDVRSRGWTALGGALRNGHCGVANILIKADAGDIVYEGTSIHDVPIIRASTLAEENDCTLNWEDDGYVVLNEELAGPPLP